MHAGRGKMLVQDHKNLEDIVSVLSLHNDYCTTEPFIDCDYELRIQKIGDARYDVI